MGQRPRDSHGWIQGRVGRRICQTDRHGMHRGPARAATRTSVAASQLRSERTALPRAADHVPTAAATAPGLGEPVCPLHDCSRPPPSLPTWGRPGPGRFFLGPGGPAGEAQGSLDPEQTAFFARPAWGPGCKVPQCPSSCHPRGSWARAAPDLPAQSLATDALTQVSAEK